MVAIFRIFDALRGPRLWEMAWRAVTRVSRLSDAEVAAAERVLGPGEVDYDSVRVAVGPMLGLVHRLNGGRAFTTFHTLNLPSRGRHTRASVALVVHELTHVRQFEKVGSVYIWQAMSAQRSDVGYRYGGWARLAEDRAAGKRLRDYNREQQGQMAEDYYREVVEADLPADSPVRKAFEPFIEDLRVGEL